MTYERSTPATLLSAFTGALRNPHGFLMLQIYKYFLDSGRNCNSFDAFCKTESGSYSEGQTRRKRNATIKLQILLEEELCPLVVARICKSFIHHCIKAAALLDEDLRECAILP